MMGRKALIAAAAVLGVTYATSPYLALFRVSRDLEAGDVDAVQSEIDWDSLRAGLKQDVAEHFAGVKVTAVAERGALPPFGASFVQGVAEHLVDRIITPEGLCAAMHGASSAPVLPLAFRGGFHGLTHFAARIAQSGAPPMTIHFRLEGVEWRVTSVHVENGART